MPAIQRVMPQMKGSLRTLVIRRNGFYEHGMPEDISAFYRARSVAFEASLRARLAFKGFFRGLKGTGIIAVGRLYASAIWANGGVEHYGLLSTKVITTAGVTFLRDDWNNNAQDFTTFNFHGVGTGTNAEAVGDTALQTESTTTLNPDNTRATGTRSTPSATVFRSVGTLTFDGATAVTEHGIFSQAATGGGTLWDRSQFSVLNMGVGDSLQFTYDCTLSAGG